MIDAAAAPADAEKRLRGAVPLARVRRQAGPWGRHAVVRPRRGVGRSQATRSDECLGGPMKSKKRLPVTANGD